MHVHNTAHEQIVIGMIAPNPYLFLWESHFLSMPTFPGMQLGHKTRPECIVKYFYSSLTLV
jgi:hypothetical protein